MEHLNLPTNIPEQPLTAGTIEEPQVLDGTTRVPLEFFEFGRHSKPETLAQEIISDSFRYLSPEQCTKVLNLYRKYGEVLAAYLSLEDTNVTDPEIEATFNEIYYGEQPLDTDFAEQYAEEQGWTTKYDEFARTSDIPPEIIHFDYDQMRYILDAMYEVVELEHGRYLFNR